MNNELYDRIDKMWINNMTADGLDIDTKIAVVSDFFDKVEEIESRTIDYEMLLLHLKDILSLYMNIPITKVIDKKIADLIASVIEELQSR